MMLHAFGLETLTEYNCQRSCDVVVCWVCLLYFEASYPWLLLEQAVFWIIYKAIDCTRVKIESIKTTSMEDVSTRVLEK